MDGYIAFIAIMGSFLTPFVYLDSLGTEEENRKLSGYILDADGFNFNNFEKQVIRVLMGVFIKNDRLRIFRIYFISAFITTISLIMVALTFNPSKLISMSWDTILMIVDSTSVTDLLILVGILIIVPIGTLIFDLISFKVTKMLFIETTPTSFMYAILKDLIFSMTPIILFFGVIVLLGKIFNLEHNQVGFETNIVFDFLWMISQYLSFFVGDVFAVLTSYLVFGLVSVFSITFLQLSVLIVGVGLRYLSKFVNLADRLSKKSRLRKAPFTILGFVLGLITNGLIAIF